MPHVLIALTQSDAEPGQDTLHLSVVQDAPGSPVLLHARDASGRLVGTVVWDACNGRVQLLAYDGRDDEPMVMVRMRPATDDDSPDAEPSGYRVAEVEVEEAGALVLTDAVVRPSSAASPWLADRDA